VSRVKAGILAPDEAFALACDSAFPHVGGWFARFYRECNGWSAPFPSWFEDWLKAEQEATTLRIWQPIIIPGLLQTPEYARALFLAGQDDTSDEAIGKLVAARMGRQAIFDKPDRPKLLVVLDEMVLHRLIGCRRSSEATSGSRPRSEIGRVDCPSALRNAKRVGRRSCRVPTFQEPPENDVQRRCHHSKQ
jgi:hypothetical protein